MDGRIKTLAKNLVNYSCKVGKGCNKQVPRRRGCEGWGTCVWRPGCRECGAETTQGGGKKAQKGAK